MAPDAAQISSRTVRSALAAFGIEDIRSISRLHGGAGVARKFVVERESRAPPTRLLLKCVGRDDAMVELTAARHAVIGRLASLGVPVVEPCRDARGGTVLADQAVVFELIPFVEGERWRPLPARARSAGEVLSMVHDATAAIGSATLNGLRDPTGLIAGDAEALIDGRRCAPDDGTEEGFLCGTLTECIDHAGRAGVASRPACVVHGDFHPGNMRWRGDDIAGLFDFDACRWGHGLEEAALASVHFSIDRGSKSMDARAPWPEADLFEAFWRGYLHHNPIDETTARTAPWLAAGAFALEALSGMGGASFSPDTVSFASGVVAWLVEHASGLGELVVQACDA